MNQFYGFDLTRYYFGKRICADSQSYNLVDGNFTNACEFQLSNQSLRLQQKEISLHQSFTKDAFTTKLYHCRSFHLSQNCPRIEVSENVTLNHSTNLISLQSLENKTVILNQTEFLPLNKNQTTFLICISSNPKPLTLTKVRKWKEDLNLAEYYLSIILVLISITFAILFIITFTLFSELRNKGNIDVFCMSMFILLSDVILSLIHI